MTEWNVETALNHHPACSIYDDGACTCGLQAWSEKIERSPLAPGEGTWSVFAEKVVAERDAAREEVERLRKEHNERTAFLRAEVDRLHRALAFARDTVHDVAHLGDADYLYDHLDKVLKGGKL